jgi:hypothetical protein
MRAITPGPVREQYSDLYERLHAATRARGQVGEAATSAFMLLQAHYRKDMEFALPPLKYLSTLARGNVTSEISRLLTLSDKLKRELPHLYTEIDRITSALQRLADVAATEQKPEHVELARRLIHFLDLERDILYPASILVGEYIQQEIALEGRRLVQAQA